MTETGDVSPDVHVARVVIADNANLARVRMLNLGEQPVKLLEGKLINGSKPVKVTGEEENVSSKEVLTDDPVVEGLMKDLVEDMPPETRGLSDLQEDVPSVDCSDEFSATDKDSRDACPVKQPVRRQPPSYQLRDRRTISVKERLISF